MWVLVGIIGFTCLFLAIPLFYGGVAQFWKEGSRRGVGEWFGFSVTGLPAMIYYGCRLASRSNGDRWAVRTCDDILEFRGSDLQRLHVSSVSGFSKGPACIYVDHRGGREEIHTTPLSENEGDVLAALEAWLIRSRADTRSIVAPIGDRGRALKPS